MFTGSEFSSIRAALDEFPIIDTHEHYGAQWAAPTVTLYDLFRDSYVGWCAHDGQLENTPEGLVRWLEPARDNSYTVSLLRGLSELYSLPVREMEQPHLAELEAKVQAAYQQPEWGLRVLRQAGIQHSIVDPLPRPGRMPGEPSFHLALRSHALVHGYDRAAVDHGGWSPFELASAMNCNISTFDDYLDFVDLWVREHKARGAVAIKSALAYERDIRVEPVSYREAAALFDCGTKNPVEQKKLGDFILNLLAQKAAQYGLVFQIHAGLALQATSHPGRLMWLFDNNPNTAFDLFHAGYPWLQDTLAMASERHNLLVDSCWLPIISPTAAVRFYQEYAEVAHRADTLLWGGDNWHAEESYAAALTFKDCLAKAVSEKVEGGYWTRRQGLRFAEGVMWRAASRWFGIAL